MNLICIIFPADWQCLKLQLESQKYVGSKQAQETNNKENWEINIMRSCEEQKTILSVSYFFRFKCCHIDLCLGNHV